MSQQELLTRVLAVLDGAGVDYMVTGSVASSLQGEPRTTHDVDLVVALAPAAVPALLAAFPPPEFFLSEEAVREAIRNRSMFDLLALDTGDKVDFWLLTDEPFDQARFVRKQTVQTRAGPLKLSAPEDTILAKLRWCKLSGGSEKQFTDALQVYQLQRDSLDGTYLDRWAAQLDVFDLWQQINSRADTSLAGESSGE